jgi:hypothetical protein
VTAPAYILNEAQREEANALLTPQNVADLRALGEIDSFFFAKTILGYDQVREETHTELCAFLDLDPSVRKLVLMPRGHLKSTICTISRSLQHACRNPHHYRCLIANENATKAEAFLHEIKQHWLKNELLRQLYPELVPTKLQGPGSDWSMTMASVNRNAVYKESTWTTVGAGGSGVGLHFNHIIPDDIVGEQHKQSPAEMNKVKIWNRSIEELLDHQDKDEICWVGTRKTPDDVYADMQEWLMDLAVFVREPIEDGRPIFPLKFSMQRLMHIMEHRPEEWAHDFMNNPVGKGGVDWGKGSVQEFWWTGDGRGVEFRAKGELRRWTFGELDIVVTVDPNSGKPLAPDKAAVIVHGVSPDDEIFVLEARSGRPSPDGLIDWTFEAAKRWRPRVIGIEDAGQQNTLQYFEKHCIEQDTHFRVEPLKHKNTEKEVRTRNALDTPIKRRKLYLMRTQLELRMQIEMFPQLSTHKKDEIDCLSYGPEIYRKGVRLEDTERRRDVQKKVIAMRGITGYGNSFKRHVRRVP